MLKISASLFLGSLFVIIGAVNVWLILQASTRVKNARASARLIAAHRIGGYIFILMFCLMSYFMISRMKDSSGTASAGTMIHMTVAMLLTPRFTSPACNNCLLTPSSCGASGHTTPLPSKKPTFQIEPSEMQSLRSTKSASS